MMRGRQRHPEKIAVIKVNIKRSWRAHTTPDNVPGILYATGPQQSAATLLIVAAFCRFTAPTRRLALARATSQHQSEAHQHIWQVQLVETQKKD